VQRRLIKECKDTYDTLVRRQKVNAKEAQDVGRALQAVETFLKNRPGNTVFEEVMTPVPPLQKGETILEGVARLRKKAAEHRKALVAIENAPRPSSEVKALAKAEIEKLAQAPDVRNLFQGGTPNWPTANLTAQLFNISERGAIGFASTVDGLALTCWLHKDALIAAVNREIDKYAQDSIAMSPATKEKAAAEMAQTLLALEHSICRLIDVGLEQKLPIEYGEEAAGAMMGITLRTVPPPPASPGSNPGRTSWPLRR